MYYKMHNIREKKSLNLKKSFFRDNEILTSRFISYTSQNLTPLCIFSYHNNLSGISQL